jgi:hypothetical protein
MRRRHRWLMAAYGHVKTMLSRLPALRPDRFPPKANLSGLRLAVNQIQKSRVKSLPYSSLYSKEREWASYPIASLGSITSEVGWTANVTLT